MKTILKALVTLLATAMPVVAFAQGSLLKQTLEIAEVDINDGQVSLSVFDMPEEGEHQYFLCVGTLGIGDDFIQVQIDPLFQLFVPLGGTLKEAQAKLEEFRDIGKAAEGTEIETIGTLALANPTTGTPEPVYVTSRRFLAQKLIEFSVKRNGYVRATHIPRIDFASLVSSVKLYKKIHPKEQ